MKKIHSQSVYKWFLSFYIFSSVIFCMILIPLFLYINNTFNSLQEEKIHNQLSAVSSSIETVVTTTDNILQTIFADRRFRSYTDKNISANELLETKDHLSLLTAPLDLIYDTVFQCDSDNNLVISKTYITPGAKVPFYPCLFYVEDLSSDEWNQLLSDYANNFLPIQRIKTNNYIYDGLVYSSHQSSGTKLYSIIRIDDLQKLLLPDNQTGYYFTLSNQKEEILYSSLPSDDVHNYRTYSIYNAKSKLDIAIHIDNDVFQQRMQPLYLFLTVYCFIVIISVLCLIVILTQISTRPILSIIQDLDHSPYIQTLSSTGDSSKKPTRAFQSQGFNYISRSIHAANDNLEKFQKAIISKDKLLQVHFLTKAINGQLIEPRDFQNFNLYFPEFPKEYRLLLVHLWTHETAGNLPYQEPLLLISSYLEELLPNIYQLQFSNSKLLLVISESDFEQEKNVLNFMINNINCEEPLYFIRCLSTKPFCSLNSLPVAYRQLQDMDRLSYPDEKCRVCFPSDHPQSNPISHTLPDFLTLYTAIAYGNKTMAISKFKEYAEILIATQTPSVHQYMHEMINTILTCIKLEHPQQLMDQPVPPYRTNTDFIDHYENIISSFCDRLNNVNKSEIELFGEQIVHYIDTHYTDPDLCLTALETHFKCSSSSIYKAFSQVSDIAVAKYITQKRLDHANRLIAQNQKSLNEISLECGFSNVNTFYKSYRRVYGHAPTTTQRINSD